MHTERAATSYDVAERAGVSQATVSRVLNGNPRVAADARARVEKALQDLQYVPNASAKTMRTARADAIGIVTSEWLNPYVPELLDALTREAKARQLNVLLWNDADPRAPMALAGAAAGAVDGVIFTAARTSTTGALELHRRGYPVVLANRAGREIALDQVTSDHEESGYRAASYFVDHDRRRIACIFGPRDTYSSPARERGFRRRLAEAGVEVAPERWIVGDTSYQDGWAGAERILALPELPEAVFCSADLIAYGAISAFRAHGVRVPEDLWLMGNDGSPMAAWAPFDLTTQRQPLEEIARLSLDRLIFRMGGGDDGTFRVTLATDFIVRGSTAHAPFTPPTGD